MSATRGFKIQAADETIKRLSDMATKLGDSITPNGIAAMATYEISRVPPDLLWQALGLIREMAETTADKKRIGRATVPQLETVR